MAIPCIGKSFYTVWRKDQVKIERTILDRLKGGQAIAMRRLIQPATF